MLVHAYGQIFGFYRAHSQRTALYVLPLERWWWALLHPHIIHHFGSIHTLSYPYIPSCSLLLRESKGGVSSSVKRLRVALSSLGDFSFRSLSAHFSRRHCCCSSWRWRGEEVPWVCCCCPGLYGYGALGRGR